jgi:hypothetical protein
MEYDNNHFIIASRAYSLHLCDVLFQYLGAPWHHNESSHCVAKNVILQVYEHIK